MNRMVTMLLISALFISTCSEKKMKSATDQYFTNPILAGFYPDPSICRVGDDFYLVTSTFAYFPGIPVFHSRDLVNWKLIGHVLDRAEQLDLEGLGLSRGIFAPAIAYHDGLFYLTCTLVDGGGNFVVTAEDPAGPWSKPAWQPEVDGIDPSLFFEKDGQAYFVYNSVAPDNAPLYDGHRTIRLFYFDKERLRVTGDNMILVNGGTDISKKPIWIEAPHIFKKDEYYYLICAEGGTSWQHSEVVFRSEKVTGPYIPYEKNPILTQRHLDPNRPNPVTCTGHADLVEIPTGDWWAVFLGCRPYLPEYEGFFNTGRETFLAPVKWIDGWPVINPDFEEVQYSYPLPLPERTKKAQVPYSGNFTLRDDFDSARLDPHWAFLRTPHEKWYDLADRPGFVKIRLLPETCSGKSNPAFIGRRQQHLKAFAATALDFQPQTENEKAGLLAFQNETYFYFLCKSVEDGAPVVQLFQSNDQKESRQPMTLLASQKIDAKSAGTLLRLRIVADGADYSFYYGFKPGKWQLLIDNVDGRFLSTRIAGGFVGSMFALYATSLGETTDQSAWFDWYEYRGDDDIYK